LLTPRAPLRSACLPGCLRMPDRPRPATAGPRLGVWQCRITFGSSVERSYWSVARDASCAALPSLASHAKREQLRPPCPRQALFTIFRRVPGTSGAQTSTWTISRPGSREPVLFGQHPVDPADLADGPVAPGASDQASSARPAPRIRGLHPDRWRLIVSLGSFHCQPPITPCLHRKLAHRS
jgi:hypothetical protein